MERLVFNRTQADVDRVKMLSAKGWANMTPEEQDEWLGVEPLDVAVSGKTTQAGTGTASPTNPRALSGVGMYDAVEVLDGTQTISTTSHPNLWFVYNTSNFVGYDPAVAPLGSNMEGILGNATANASAYSLLDPGQMCFRAGSVNDRLYLCIVADSVAEVKAKLAASPLTVWYKKKVHPKGGQYYTGVSEVGADGYRGYGVPLTAPLFDGDKIENDVDGQCVETRITRQLVLDGTETWYDYRAEENTDTYFGFRMVDPVPLANGSYAAQSCSHLAYGAATSEGYVPNTFRVHATSASLYVRVEIAGVTSASTWRSYLAAQAAAGTPVTVVYRMATTEVWTHNRVVKPVETACTRGAYNVRDLNRVEGAIGEIAVLNDLTLTVKTNWKANDVPRVADMDRLWGNIQSIKNNIPTASAAALPTGMARLTWQGANAIEQFLNDAYFSGDELVVLYDNGNVIIAAANLSAVPSDNDAAVIDGAITVTADDDGNVTFT